MKSYYRVQANINLDAIVNNIKKTREIVKDGTKIMAVIKADGYGHGAVSIAKVLDSLVELYGIAILEEGMELREAGIDKPLLILGFTPEPLYGKMLEYNIMPTIYTYDMAEKISKEAKKQNKDACVHIKLDTGMNRIGFKLNEESIKEIKAISQMSHIKIDGCFSHFARADEKDKTFTYKQLAEYLNFINRLEEEGVKIPTKHISNSAAIMEVPEANLDMVRSGISTYGLYASNEVDSSKLHLEPAMEIKACISYVKEVEAGEGISYNSTFVTKRKTKIATIPVGYGDGYPRALSSNGRVLIKGKSAPILGRICMDQFMVDVTDIENVEMGDTATLVGRDGEEFISVEELSQKSHSFHYEFVCDVGKRIPRVYYFGGEKVGISDYYRCNAIEWKL